LRSPPPDIRSVRSTHPVHGSVVFIDTPGFNATDNSDVVILTMITDWLVKIYKGNINLAAIVYLHKIDDNRITGSLLKNLELFVGLCGQKAMPNVVIATTMWGNVSADEGKQREEELKEQFWKGILDNGGRTERFNGTQESAWDIIGSIMHTTSSTTLLIQEEIVDGRRSLLKTKAGTHAEEKRLKVPKGLMNIFRNFFLR
jgi:hypothetical protein